MSRYRRFLVVLGLTAIALVAGPAATALESPASGRGSPARVGAAELPKEARDTLALIRQGGPYPYAKDGTTFSNREHILPKQPRGYYHEYTVPTPMARNRGARRIIAGGQAERYYTADHYRTFWRIRR